jgi:lactoylglutathione lyase
MTAGAKGGANVRDVVPFLNVSNMERSLSYYADGLGFGIKYKWVVDGRVRWCWLERGGGALMLRAIEASEPVVGNGMWVTTLSDPDGYRINFESATDAPEDTRLSDWKG